jgi:hypothetical protein
LFEVFDHLFDLPAFRIISKDIERREMEIGRDKITGFLSLLFHDHDRNLAEVLDEADKPSDLKSLLFSIEGDRDLSVGRTKGGESGYFSPLPIDEDNGIRSQLRDHMIPPGSTDLSQGLSPIPAICQEIDFTGDREAKILKHLFNQANFGSKRAASFGSFRVIEVGPERQKKVLIKESKEHPLVAEDMGFACPVFMPGTSGHLRARLFGNGVIHDKKDDRTGVDSQMMEELGQSDLCDLFHGPDVFSKESCEA